MGGAWVRKSGAVPFFHFSLSLPTHGAPCEYFENEWRYHIYIHRQGGFHQEYQAMLKTVTWYTGPGVLLSHQLFGDVESIELIANTPV